MLLPAYLFLDLIIGVELQKLLRIHQDTLKLEEEEAKAAKKAVLEQEINAAKARVAKQQAELNSLS